MLYKLSNVSIFLSNYNLNMDLIKSIHISSVEEAEDILKSENKRQSFIWRVEVHSNIK